MDKVPPNVIESPEELSPKAGYAAWASFYDDDGNPLLALEGPAVRSLFGPIDGRFALDLGCGTGRHTIALVDSGARVVALDQSPEMMTEAGRKLSGSRGVAWIQHSLPDPLPFAAATFDLAVMGLVAEHVANLDSVMRELARVVRPGGRCILSALHPDRTAEGQRARFIDPETGLRRPITTIHRETRDYRQIASSAGWRLIAELALVVPHELAERLPRAVRYIGMALGWVACWDRPNQVGVATEPTGLDNKGITSTAAERGSG